MQDAVFGDRRADRPRLVLASSSPRRRELLALIGVWPAIVLSPDVDETPRPGEDPADLVRRLAGAKAEAGVDLDVVARPVSTVTIGADTVVALDGEILGKPTDFSDARRMLEALNGRSHDVFTGVAATIVENTGEQRTESVVVRTAVDFRPLTIADIDWYLSTKEWNDRAGSYAIQGAGGFLVAGLRGSYHNVVGLPLAELDVLLSSLGHPLRSWIDD